MCIVIISLLLFTFAGLIKYVQVNMLVIRFVHQAIAVSAKYRSIRPKNATNEYMHGCATARENIYQTVGQTQCHIFLKTRRNHALLIKLATAVKCQEHNICCQAFCLRSSRIIRNMRKHELGNTLRKLLSDFFIYDCA